MKQLTYINDDNLLESIQRLGNSLIDELEIPIAENPLDAQQSKFFKTIYQYTRQSPTKQFIIDKE